MNKFLEFLKYWLKQKTTHTAMMAVIVAVVAFRDGSIGMDNLTDQVAALIISAITAYQLSTIGEKKK